MFRCQGRRYNGNLNESPSALQLKPVSGFRAYLQVVLQQGQAKWHLQLELRPL